jgi:hypothetical protein
MHINHNIKFVQFLYKPIKTKFHMKFVQLMKPSKFVVYIIFAPWEHGECQTYFTQTHVLLLSYNFINQTKIHTNFQCKFFH